MSHWWTGIPPAQATVSSGGHTHALRWETGELSAIDHGDPEPQVTVAGQMRPCLELLRTCWAAKTSTAPAPRDDIRRGRVRVSRLAWPSRSGMPGVRLRSRLTTILREAALIETPLCAGSGSSASSATLPLI
jgi:hypothetical protein